jgi:hypothetical protein
MNSGVVFLLIVAAFVIGRCWQWVIDAKGAMSLKQKSDR